MCRVDPIANRMVTGRSLPSWHRIVRELRQTTRLCRPLYHEWTPRRLWVKRNTQKILGHWGYKHFTLRAVHLALGIWSWVGHTWPCRRAFNDIANSTSVDEDTTSQKQSSRSNINVMQSLPIWIWIKEGAQGPSIRLANSRGGRCHFLWRDSTNHCSDSSWKAVEWAVIPWDWHSLYIKHDEGQLPTRCAFCTSTKARQIRSTEHPESPGVTATLPIGLQ